MRRWLISMLGCMLLAACGGNVRTTEPVQYDFGNLAGSGAGVRVPLASVDVQAASWLAGSAMHFRLSYADPLRRQSYAESRWAAPPAELFEAFLKRRMLFGQPEFNGGGCRLQLALDELEQRFADPQSSQMVVEVRASLTPLRGSDVLSRRAFAIQRPATAATARGGAAAAGGAALGLADELDGWLAEIARTKPAVVERCRT